MSENEKPNSRNVPLPIQRSVRQRCGFGCVICGLPLYEYEHMEEWAKVQRHVAEEITLLCDQHHTEKTKGLLPKDAVRDANKSPFNLQPNNRKPYHLHFSGEAAEIWLATTNFRIQKTDTDNVMHAIVIDGEPILGFEIQDNTLLLNLKAYDEFNELSVLIEKNQLIYSKLPWDIQFVGTTLTIRKAHREILLEINFQPPSKISITNGRLLRNGVEVLINRQEVSITNYETTISDCEFTNFPASISIGPRNDWPSAISIPNVPRYKQNCGKES